MNKTILDMKNVSVYFNKNNVHEWTIEDISLNLKEGEILGIIGESGSGKTLLINSILRPYKHNVKIRLDGEINFYNENLFDCSDDQLKSISGKKISMIFQNPESSLNPYTTLGAQMIEAIEAHNNCKYSGNLIEQALKDVGFNAIHRIFKSYPSEFSGGQLQRFCIAMALVNNPDIILADEPTTALDIFHQFQIIQLLKKIRKEKNISILLITHELPLALNLCDNIAVMKSGRIVEYKNAKLLFEKPEHEYTKLLTKVFPWVKLSTDDILGEISRNEEDIRSNINVPNKVPLLRLVNISKVYSDPVGNFTGVKNISFDIFEGESVGIIGRSGSGKSTIAKLLTCLIMPDSGQLYWENDEVSVMKESSIRKKRNIVQIVFQNPLLSLNPHFTTRMTLRNSLIQAKKLCNIKDIKDKDIDLEIAYLMDLVELKDQTLDLFPHELSGGEQQRLSIARALSVRPKLLVCDESTNSLDASIRYHLLKKLKDIQQRFNMAILFISHNLAITADMSTKILILSNGEIVEKTDHKRIFLEQNHDETKKIVEANSFIM